MIAQCSSWKKLTAVFALAALVLSLTAVSAETAYAADKGTVTSYTATTSKAKFATAKMGKTAGKASKKAPAVTQVKMKLKGAKGSVKYTVCTSGKWSKAAKDGKVAGKKGKATQGLTVKLSGTAAKTYDVYYRVYIKGYGWMGWAKNGAKAGTNDKSKAMTAYQVKLVAKKGGKAPNMDRKAYSSKSGFINKITGVAKVDDNIKKFCQKNGMDLKKCFAALDKKYQYANTGYSAIKGAFKSDRFKKEAQLFFKNFKNGVKKSGTQGDCYSAAAGLAAVAQHLGYNATAVTGKAELKNKNTGELTILNTAWTEIKVNGKKTVSTLLYHVYADPYDGEQGAKFKKN